MFGINSKNQYDESIKNPPSDDSYPMLSILFSKNNVCTNRLKHQKRDWHYIANEMKIMIFHIGQYKRIVQ